MENEDPIKIISSLAEQFPDPEEFIDVLERLNVPENEKGNLLFDIRYYL
jgi:hypothetical protein